jgi:predicted SnoaL-like aldol condensation-catalyzing enzyme
LNSTPSANPIAQANKQLVSQYYAAVWNARDADATTRFVADEYIQHNPNIANGRMPLQAFLAGFFQQLPDAKFKVVRLVAEDDLVVAHSLFSANALDRGTAVVDVYRIQDGKLVEHWDVKEPVPDSTANGNPMV